MNIIKLPLMVAYLGASAYLFAQSPEPGYFTGVNAGELIRADVYQRRGSNSPQAMVTDVYAAPLPPAAYTVINGNLEGLNVSNNTANVIVSGTQTVEYGSATTQGGQAHVKVSYKAFEAGGQYDYSRTVNNNSAFQVAWSSHNAVSYTSIVDANGNVKIKYTINYTLLGMGWPKRWHVSNCAKG